MKYKHYISVLFASAFATSVFAVVTDIDTVITHESDITLNAGDTWNIIPGGQVILRAGWGGSPTYTINGNITNSSATEFLIINSRESGGSLTTVNFNNSSVTSTANATLAWGKDGGNSVAINLINTTIASTSGTLNFEIGRNNNTLLNIDSTSSMSGNSLTMATRPGDFVRVININGGSINLTGNVDIARDGSIGGNGGSGEINVLAGGSLTASSLNLNPYQGSATRASQATVLVQGVGSSLTVNSNLNLGLTAITNADDSGTLTLHTGTTTTVANEARINNYGTLKVVLDSSSLTNDDTSVLFTTKDSFFYNNGTSDPIVIDGELLTTMGTDVTIALFKFTANEGNVKLNDVRTVFGDLQSSLEDFITFDHNTGNQYWEDFGYGNLTFANNTIYLTLTAIPEPSTYAAIFGALALALAFVLYRRKR